MRKKFLILLLAGTLAAGTTGCGEIGNLAAGVAGNLLFEAGKDAVIDYLEDSAGSSTRGGHISGTFDFGTDIPDFSGSSTYIVNDNEPFFTEEELAEAAEGYEFYSDLDEYGRCGYAMASVGEETMPEAERGDISSIHPTGWWGMKESTIGPERCHLIAYMLTGENANEKNLVTGTRQMNVSGAYGDGMLAYESKVSDQIEDNGGHVLYRVTPDFRSNDELCRGVLMEAESVEDNGETLKFCVYVYNVSEGWEIDYSLGTAEYTGESTAVSDDTAYGDTASSDIAVMYYLNTNSKKIHSNDDCSAYKKASKKNKKESNQPLKALETDGYTKCSICFGS